MKEHNSNHIVIPLLYVSGLDIYHQNTKRIYWILIQELVSVDDFAELYVGIDYNCYEEINNDFKKAVDYSIKLMGFYDGRKDYSLKISYVPPSEAFSISKIFVYVFCKKNNCNASISICDCDLDDLYVNIIDHDIDISQELAGMIYDSIHNEFNSYAKSTIMGEDDRCFLKDVFCIHVNEKELCIEDKSFSHDHYEYLDRGRRSKYKGFDCLMKYIYVSLSAEERRVFPYK